MKNVLTQPYRRPTDTREDNYLVTLAKEYDLLSAIKLAGKENLLDVSDFVGLKNLIDSTKPDIIINCIGLLNKTAEDNPDQAVLINSYLTK